jgi:type II secretory ATPase GspE/PulE/Tfp pilus assembly ATPase PilB-like protein
VAEVSDFIDPATSLRDAIRRTFVQRPEVSDFEFAGAEAQAWTAYARMLALTPADLARAIAPTFGVEAAGPLHGEAIDAEVLALVPYDFCQKHSVLPLRWKAGALEVATFQFGSADLRARVSFVVGKPVRWLLAPPVAIEDAILAAYSRDALRYLQHKPMGPKLSTLEENAIVRLARELMSRAVRARASDLHIQPYLGSSVARIRVDGALRRLTVLPDVVAGMLISHLKASGGMQPTTKLIPQDGRMSLVVDGCDYALRLSTLPVSGGERFVIRFLPQSQVHRLANAGFSLAALQTLRRAVARPSGMVVFTGPTGSGKTSTLCAMLGEINRSDINIITVENPVEYRIPGVSQVEVNDKANRTFGTALRSILRQDPDVILIGEIRDAETAEIATQAAMTGHLVLTTLHTNDALTAIPRLLDLGVQPSILADALVVVASQRLCRRLCPDCRAPVHEPLAPDERAFREITHNTPAYRAIGCQKCDFTGFLGRLPIVDIIEMNPAMRDAVATGESRLSLLAGLRDGGLKSLAASGSLRVISGDTTVSEVATAVGPNFWPELAGHYGTYFSDLALDSLPRIAVTGLGILLISGDESLGAVLQTSLAPEGLRLVKVPDAQAAESALRDDEDIAYIVGDLPEGADLATAVATLQRNRAHISWARLPSAVLVPVSLAGQDEALRESGVMADFCHKPLNVPEIVGLIRRAQAR